MNDRVNNHKAWQDAESRYQDMFEAAKLINPDLTEEQFEAMYKTFDHENKQ